MMEKYYSTLPTFVGIKAIEIEGNKNPRFTPLFKRGGWGCCP